MTPEERSLLQNFLNDLAASRAGQKDGEAKRMINDVLRASPDAAYLLVQHAILSDQALHAAQDQISGLQEQMRNTQAPAQQPSRFLGGRGGQAGPSPWARAASAPPPQDQYAAASASGRRLLWTRPVQSGRWPWQLPAQCGDDRGGRRGRRAAVRRSVEFVRRTPRRRFRGFRRRIGRPTERGHRKQLLRRQLRRRVRPRRMGYWRRRRFVRHLRRGARPRRLQSFGADINGRTPAAETRVGELRRRIFLLRRPKGSSTSDGGITT